MWLFTGAGFVSVVRDRHDSSKVWVRARYAGDIAALLPQYVGDVVMQPGADYLYRCLVNKSDLAVAMMDLIMNLDYTGHAKEAMVRTAPTEPGRYSALMSTWSVWSSEQYPYPAYSSSEKSKRGPNYPKPVKTYSSYGAYSPAKGTGTSASADNISGSLAWGDADDEYWDERAKTTYKVTDDDLDFMEGFGETPVGFGLDDGEDTGTGPIPDNGDDILYNDGLTNAQFNNMTQLQYEDHLASIGLRKQDVALLPGKDEPVHELGQGGVNEAEVDDELPVVPVDIDVQTSTAGTLELFSAPVPVESVTKARLAVLAYPPPDKRPAKGTREFKRMRSAQRMYQRKYGKAHAS